MYITCNKNSNKLEFNLSTMNTFILVGISNLPSRLRRYPNTKQLMYSPRATVMLKGTIYCHVKRDKLLTAMLKGTIYCYAKRDKLLLC